MSQFSKATLHKLNSHLGKLKEANNYYKENYQFSKEKNLNHSKVLIRNKNLAKALLIELMFFNIEALKIENPKISLINKFLLKNKKNFINHKLYNNSYLSDENGSSTHVKYTKKKIYSEISKFELSAFPKI